MKENSPVKKRIFDVIQIGNRGDLPSRLFDYLIVTTIFLNITVLFLETFDVFAPLYPLLEVIEKVTMVIFIIEYALRIWTANYLYPDRSYPKAVLRFIFSFNGIVDLLTILPFFFLAGFIGFRILRVFRIFRLFRINSTYDSFHVIASVFHKKKNQIFSSVLIIFILMLVSSLCIYNAEHEAQPGVFKDAFSGLWWSLSTIFTVGYGDIYPITWLGKAMTMVITLLGVGAVAIPTGIISAGFVEQYAEVVRYRKGERENRETICKTIGPESEYIGKTVVETEEINSLNIVAIMRNGEILIPSSSTAIQTGDMLICQRQEGDSVLF